MAMAANSPATTANGKNKETAAILIGTSTNAATRPSAATRPQLQAHAAR
jgi:hypothetical protein